MSSATSAPSTKQTRNNARVLGINLFWIDLKFDPPTPLVRPQSMSRLLRTALLDLPPQTWPLSSPYCGNYLPVATPPTIGFPGSSLCCTDCLAAAPSQHKASTTIFCWFGRLLTLSVPKQVNHNITRGHKLPTSWMWDYASFVFAAVPCTLACKIH
jgi:hypothetical protein